MTVDDVIKYYGSSYKFHKQTPFSHGAFFQWKKKGRVPLLSQLKIEKLTNGELKANMDDLK